MACFHPDPPHIPDSLASERVVLAALRTLPPETHVLVRLCLLEGADNHEKEMDFVVLHPELGIVIIETKGKGVQPNGDHWVRHSPDGRVERLKEDPTEQLRNQQWFLLQWLQQRVKGFIPQVTRVLALPFYPGQVPDLGPDLPACRVLTAEKLKSPYLALREAVAGGSWEAFRTSRSASLHRLTPERRDALLSALTPKVLPPPSLAELLADEAATQDREAERLLDHLALNFSRGRYRVQGAPGSGKSWLGRKVARLWAAEGRRVLVVAFNRALTYATQCALDDLIRDQGAVASTFHDLAASLLGELGELPTCAEEPAAKQAFFNQELPDAFNAALPRIRQRWDALVVDEAQDLDPAWVRSLLGLLANPGEDPVLVLEDPAQSIYRSASHALGQPWRLDLCLRQSARLRNTAVRAFPGCGWREVPEPDEAPRDTYQAMASSPKRWREDLEDQLSTLCAEGLRPEQVIVLSPHRPARLGLKDAQKLGPWPLNLEADWWEGDKAEHVRMGTIHAFKGLEADVVIYLAPAYEHREAERLRYTAISRARHRVIVLESAIPELVVPKTPTVPAAPMPPKLAPPPPRPKPVCELGEGNRQALMEALKAARRGPNHKRPPAPDPCTPALMAKEA